jgi:hypothetical protein
MVVSPHPSFKTVQYNVLNVAEFHAYHPEEFPSKHNVQAHILQIKPWTFYIKNHSFLTEQQHRI